MKRFLITFFVPFLMMSSCSTPYISEIQEIDSLIVVLDSAKKSLHGLDTGEIYRRAKTSAKQLSYLQGATDTVSREEIFVIDNYAAYSKAYNKWSKKIDNFFESVEVVPRQLENLKTDLSKNLIPEEKVKTYMDNERMAAEALSDNIFRLTEGMDRIDTSYAAAHEKILHLIQRLDSTNQSLN